MSQLQRFLTSDFIKTKLKESGKEKNVPKTKMYTMETLFLEIVGYASQQSPDKFKHLFPENEEEVDNMSHKTIKPFSWYPIIHGAVNDTKKSAQVNSHAKAFAKFVCKTVLEKEESDFVDVIIALIIKLIDARFGVKIRNSKLNDEILQRFNHFRTTNEIWKRKICLPDNLLTVFKFAGSESEPNPRFAVPEATDDEEEEETRDDLDISCCSQLSQKTIHESYLPNSRKLELENEKRKHLQKEKKQVLKDLASVNREIAASDNVIKKLNNAIERERENTEITETIRKVIGEDESKKKIKDILLTLPLLEKIRKKMGAETLMEMALKAGTKYGIKQGISDKASANAEGDEEQNKIESTVAEVDLDREETENEIHITGAVLNTERHEKDNEIHIIGEILDTEGHEQDNETDITGAVLETERHEQDNEIDITGAVLETQRQEKGIEIDITGAVLETERHEKGIEIVLDTEGQKTDNVTEITGAGGDVGKNTTKRADDLLNEAVRSIEQYLSPNREPLTYSENVTLLNTNYDSDEEESEHLMAKRRKLAESSNLEPWEDEFLKP